jgi:glycosyltransferase involved in cell wall biosynthesis
LSAIGFSCSQREAKLFLRNGAYFLLLTLFYTVRIHLPAQKNFPVVISLVIDQPRSVLMLESSMSTGNETNLALQPKYRVLIIVEAANPEWVSVPLVGWSLAYALRAVANIHIVTQLRNREAFLRAGLSEDIDFTVIDSERIAAPMARLASILRMGEGKGWTTATAMSAISYRYFEFLAWKRFGGDIKAGKYDLVHRITPLTPTAVSPIAAKCAAVNVPFILGPLNGGVPWPKGFDSERVREREWLSYLRALYRFQPGHARMMRSAAAIIVGSLHTQSELPHWAQEKSVYIPENGIDPSRFIKTAAHSLDKKMRACFVGRLVPYKGPDILLEAARELLEEDRLHIDLVGAGPMESQLRVFVSENHLESNVTFHGMIDHTEVQNILTKADFLAFPSIREFGGGVVLEAMWVGVVPLIVDYAGPGELVTNETGFKVPIGTRDDIVEGFRSRMIEILENRSELKNMAALAQTRARTLFSWQAKARQVLQVYDWAQKKSTTKPRPFSSVV